MQIKSKEILMIDVNEILPHEKNPNEHSKKQIERLAKIIKSSGFRNPLIVSTLSGRLIAGHGRLLAAKKIGMEKVPVIFQEFASEDEEYQHLVADNAIASWADLDLSSINGDLPELGPDFDIDLLGIEDFVLDLAEKETKNTSAELDLGSFDNFQHECPKCGFEWNDDGTT